jgi:hypothetical protein
MVVAFLIAAGVAASAIALAPPKSLARTALLVVALIFLALAAATGYNVI